ncbi:hypothetical protein ASD65_13245 [Microbacterium sp. Root61]|nr:hypothetical protein ASD65_13245 [Microbacterium sp. Root61]
MIAATALMLSGCFAGPGDAVDESAPAAQPQVEIAQGELTGVATAAGVEYLGIPFAKPPVGDLRWRAPEAPEPWAGVLDASKPGPDCAQTVNGDSDGSLSENCLYLDVYAPEGAEDEKLPVVVFLHGGGYTAGTPNIYDGRNFAATGESVTVIPAYRLGLFGFFATPATAAEGEYGAQGNWGMLDQQQALRWVQENIESFGGDPDNVTIVGESAGGGAVCFQLASPTAEGLFDKAVIQSMGCGPGAPAADTTEFTTQWGCAADDADCLRAVPTATIVGTPAGFGDVYPASGGPDQPVGPLEAAADGTLADVPIMMGVTRDEWLGFASAQYPLDPVEYEAGVTAQFGPLAPQVLELYPADAGEDPIFASGWLSGDSMFACPSVAGADTFADAGRSVYFYEFADETTPGWRSLGDPFPPSTIALGATHTTELQYLFNYAAAQRSLNEEQRALADQMVDLWLSFVQTGTPSVEGGPEWTTFAEGREVMELKTADAGGLEMVDTFETAHNCGFWNGLG